MHGQDARATKKTTEIAPYRVTQNGSVDHARRGVC